MIEWEEPTTINGWTISRLPEGFDFKYKVVRAGFEEKFYTFAAAVDYAESH